MRCIVYYMNSTFSFLCRYHVILSLTLKRLTSSAGEGISYNVVMESYACLVQQNQDNYQIAEALLKTFYIIQRFESSCYMLILTL